MSKYIEYNACDYCGSRDHVVDHTHWDRVCIDCGMVSCAELEMEDVRPDVVYRKPKQNHFRVKLAQCQLTDVKNQDVDVLEDDFQRYVRRFEETKRIHGRSSMIHYHFLLQKMLAKRGFMKASENLNGKQPKLKKTILALEKIWLIIDKE